MKIAVTSTGPTLDDCVGTKFSCTEYVLIIDIETMEYIAMMNPAMVFMLNGPAGGQLLVEQLSQQNVRRVLVGDSSSNILRSLGTSEVEIVVGVRGSVRKVVEEFKEMWIPKMRVCA
jgi:predicted Fe-Mo cluster-binding NifX family protein